MEGHIHSLESFGTVDGPGVRFVVFFQGCPMRCLYCHNPDTWEPEGGQVMEPDAILDRLERNRAFYETGGLTATGGEPMLQIEFLTELFEKAAAGGIHTCLDTSGICFRPGDQAHMEQVDRLLAHTGLVMLDIKHMDPEEHRRLTGHGSDRVFAFARYLCEKKVPVWIRHVVVPGITWQREELKALGLFLRELPNVEKLEILPYHSMGRVKYRQLGIEYPLEGTPQLGKDEAAEAEEIVKKAWGCPE